jgi:hypothetical protein
MKEKQFDHIENKIRAAAENSDPDFDEQSWQKMEQLLDKENDRRRPLAWFILPVLLCALIAGYFIFNKNDVSKKDSVKTGDKMVAVLPSEKTIKDNIAPEKKEQTQHTAVVITDEDTRHDDLSNFNHRNVSDVNGRLSFHNRVIEIKTSSTSLIEEKTSVPSHYKHSTKGKTKVVIRPSVPVEETEDKVVSISDESIDNTLSLPKPPSIITSTDSTITAQKKILPVDTSVKNIATNNNTENKKARTPSRFYFLASAGLEASSVKFLSTSGSATVGKYGLGAGYQLGKRIAAQAGFNVSRKKYIAGTEDYKAKPGSYWSMVEIKKVDANCLVYEIPLALRYDVLQKNKFNLYATAGISSFIMKREDYQYDYIRDNTFYQRSWTYTGNKNFLSVVSVSAGVEAKLNNGFSLLAEPSVSVPVSGVGDGKVKLYSMGLQVGLKYQPFKNKKK